MSKYLILKNVDNCATPLSPLNRFTDVSSFLMQKYQFLTFFAGKKYIFSKEGSTKPVIDLIVLFSAVVR